MSDAETTPDTVDMDPFLVVGHDSEHRVVVMLDPTAFDSPALWGIVLADVLAHLVNASVEQGLDSATTRAAVLDIFLAEVEALPHDPDPSTMCALPSLCTLSVGRSCCSRTRPGAAAVGRGGRAAAARAALRELPPAGQGARTHRSRGGGVRRGGAGRVPPPVPRGFGAADEPG